MRAPDYLTLYDLSNAVERAVVSLFDSALPDLQLCTARDDDLVAAGDCWSVKFTPGPWSNWWGTSNEEGRGRAKQAAWKFELRLKYHLSSRPGLHNLDALLSRIVAQADAMRPHLTPETFGPDLLPFHSLMVLKERLPETSAAQAPVALTYEGTLAIRPTAWPVV